MMAEKKRILIVDDEPHMLRLLQYNLEKAGMEIVMAVNGAEALNKINDYIIHLVVLDLMMPVMDGLEVCKRIKAEDKTRNTPVVVLTAKAQESEKAKVFAAGADEYMTKPFSPEELLQSINSLLVGEN